MHILMIKNKEDENFVWYNFEKDVGIEPYIDNKGRKRFAIEKKTGLFKYDKKIKNTKEEELASLEIIKEKTDEIFWNTEHPHFDECARTKLLCWVKMYHCKQANFYPNIVEYASG